MSAAKNAIIEASAQLLFFHEPTPSPNANPVPDPNPKTIPKLIPNRKPTPNLYLNKVRYTATLVACGWTGAVMEVTGAFRQEQ